jgi:hypothetical protein
MSSLEDQRKNGNGDGRGRHPNSLKALKLHGFQPGQSGNPAGRQTAGATVKEHWNRMAGWTMPQLEVVLNDPATTVAERAAAKQWIAAMLDGQELDRIINHTDGRPKQGVELSGQLETINSVRPALDKLMANPETRDALLTIADRLSEVTPDAESANN